MKFTSEFNIELLEKLVSAVEENNADNGGEWRDWRWNGSAGIFDLYAGENEWDEGVEEVLEDAIYSNGESLKEDLPAVEFAVWGQNFSGSFFDRK